MVVHPDRWREVLDGFDEKNDPATVSDLKRIQECFGERIEASVLNLLRVHDGTAGFFPSPNDEGAFINFFGVEQIIAENNRFDGFNLQDSGVILIGDDGAGEYFAWKHSGEPRGVMALPMVSNDPRDLLKVSDNFQEFIEKASAGTLFAG